MKSFKYIAREVPVVVRHIAPTESKKYDVLFIMEVPVDEWSTIRAIALHLHTRKGHKVYLEYIGFDDYELLYAFDVQRMSPTEFRINYSLCDSQCDAAMFPLPSREL